MYNSKLKKRFINECITNPGSKRNFEYLFKRSEETEQLLNKDVHEMNLNELDNLIKSYTNRTFDMVIVNVTHLREYINFCIREGYVPSRINFLNGLSRKDLTKYIDVEVSNNRYITYEQLKDMEDQCINPQDAIVPRLLFVGLKGEELSELINLKISDVYEDKIILPNREIPIDLSTYELIQDAYNQERYIRGNGELNEMAKLSENIINPSEYVIKQNGANKFGAINYVSLRARLNRVRKYFGNPHLKPRNIWVSGMLWHLKQVYDQKGVLDKDDYVRVHRIYGFLEDYFFKTKEEFERVFKVLYDK